MIIAKDVEHNKESMLLMACATHVIHAATEMQSRLKMEERSFNESLELMFVKFTQELHKVGAIKTGTSIADVNKAVKNLLEQPGFTIFAHYELCECQRKNNADNQ